MKKLLSILALFAFSYSANAALLSADWKISGDGLITKDTATGLEWLDWTQSTSRSFDTVSTQFGIGGDFEGFRYASETELNAFFTGAGLAATPPAGIAGSFTAIQDLLSGGTLVYAINGITDSSTTQHKVTRIYNTEYYDLRHSDYLNNQSHPFYAHTLVRGRALVPDHVSTFLALAFAMSALVSTKRILLKRA